jgi:hypothetical protein
MSQTHYPERWIERLRTILEIPAIHETYRFFEAQGLAEGGTATWNPLNSTNHVSSTEGPWQGSDYNNIGVCNYNKAYRGIIATADNLMDTKYQTLINTLRSAKANDLTAEDIVNQCSSEIRTWGTNPTLMLEVLKNIT